VLRGWFIASVIALVGCSLTIDFDKYAQGDKSTGTGGFGSGTCRADLRSPCDVCLSSNCCPQANACYADPSCNSANDRNEFCMNQHTTAMVCYEQFGTSGPLAGELYRCLMDQCTQPCQL
jgi:hypothetical protein